MKTRDQSDNGFQERLRAILEHKKISAIELSRQLGVSNGTVGSYMGARRSKPSFEFLEAMASRMPDISLQWLLTGEGDMATGVAAPVLPKSRPAPTIQDMVEVYKEQAEYLKSQLAIANSTIQHLIIGGRPAAQLSKTKAASAGQILPSNSANRANLGAGLGAVVQGEA